MAVVVVVLALLLCGRYLGQDYPFRNVSLSFEDRVKVYKKNNTMIIDFCS
jgi:uncharacterized protein involved in cysteine biosynthesis